ncbi:MAG: DUF4070 domain-containing protein [bacterium]|nr:DUF4070 domain-containing protein [bacterium]
MKILIVSPLFPDTFWSFKYAIKFLKKKAAFPPLGLLTIASMLPEKWEKRMFDMNTDKLSNKDIIWADYVFIGAMIIQSKSTEEVIERCRKYETKIVAGGPLFTMNYELYKDTVDHLILNEAEVTLPGFLNDLENGVAKQIYTDSAFADIKDTPIPSWHLVDFKKYASMSIQYSRGCPFECDFCNVTSLFGRKMRQKSSTQIIAELNGIYDNGYRGAIFFVDDNFIGTIASLKRDLLPALINWRKHHPDISFFTEVSINISDDDQLMNLMREAGFDQVFIGIETPNNDGLAESNKKQNNNRNLINDIKKIQKNGLQVQAGFIVGFDSDTEDIFQRQVDFIQESGITTAMVGLLQAPPGTSLYRKMQKMNRLLKMPSGDNADGSTNIVPVSMDLDTLVNGYKNILAQIYAPKNYYKRIKIFLEVYKNDTASDNVSMNRISAFLKSILRIGILGRERHHYWKLLLWTCIKHPKSFPTAVNLSILGFHFRKTVKNYIQ